VPPHPAPHPLLTMAAASGIKLPSASHINACDFLGLPSICRIENNTIRAATQSSAACNKRLLAEI
jgi:hypothetical protein